MKAERWSASRILVLSARLLISAVGDEQLVELSALPRELGCGVLLKPKVDRGKTNLILETTSGTVNQVVEITKNTSRLLEVELKETRK